MMAQSFPAPHSPLCGLPQTFKQRLHNSYSYVINAAADYVLLRPLVRDAWCALVLSIKPGVCLQIVRDEANSLFISSICRNNDW